MRVAACCGGTAGEERSDADLAGAFLNSATLTGRGPHQRRHHQRGPRRREPDPRGSTTLAIMPTGVRRQIENTAGLLSEARIARVGISALGIRYTVEPVHREGPRSFLRAHGEGDFEHLAFREYTPLQHFTTLDRSGPRSTGSSTRFVVDLPANQLGPGWRKRA
jgi:hypothetical protein